MSDMTSEELRMQRKAAKAILWLCAICLVFAFACVAFKVDPTQRMLDFIVWIVGLTFASLVGGDGIELLKPKVKTP
jgi:L-asparagine transporter-like permease